MQKSVEIQAVTEGIFGRASDTYSESQVGGRREIERGLSLLGGWLLGGWASRLALGEVRFDCFGLGRQRRLGAGGVIGKVGVRSDQLVHPGLEVGPFDQFVDPLLPRKRADQVFGRQHRQQETGRVHRLPPEQGHEPYSRYGTTGAQGLLDILQGDPLLAEESAAGVGGDTDVDVLLAITGYVVGEVRLAADGRTLGLLQYAEGRRCGGMIDGRSSTGLALSSHSGTPGLVERWRNAGLQMKRWLWPSGGGSEQPALSEGKGFRAPDHEMVQNANVDGAERGLEPLGQPLIGLGRFRHAGRMVVIENNGRSIQCQGALDDLAGIHARAIDGASEQILGGDHGVLVVQEQATEYLVLQVPDLKPEVILDFRRVAQARALPNAAEQDLTCAFEKPLLSKMLIGLGGSRGRRLAVCSHRGLLGWGW